MLQSNWGDDSKLQLRPVEVSDLDILYQWENNMEIWEVSNRLTPFSRFQLKQYIKAAGLDIYQSKELRLMIDICNNEHTTKTVGIIDLFDFEPYHNRAGVGILIHQDYRNQRVASATLKIFEDYCKNSLGLHQLYCNIAEDNHTSLALFKQLNYSLIGEKKAWIKTIQGYKSELMFQKIL